MRVKPDGANRAHVVALLGQTLEVEEARVAVYQVAVELASSKAARQHWTKCLADSRINVKGLHWALSELEVPAASQSMGRDVVKQVRKLLETRLQAKGPESTSELVAAEWALLLEQQAELAWRVIGEVAQVLRGRRGQILRAACDEHVHHPGTREVVHALWIERIGIPPITGIPAEPRRPLLEWLKRRT